MVGVFPNGTPVSKSTLSISVSQLYTVNEIRSTLSISASRKKLSCQVGEAAV